MKIQKYLRRPINIAVAVILSAAGLLPLLTPGVAHAYGQITNRSIEMSNSLASATGVSYLTTFTPATTASLVQGMIVDFCSTDPIIGDTCTAPSGFSVGTPTISGFTLPGESGGSWTATSLNSGRTLEIYNSSATGTPSGSAASFTLTTATNPSAANTTFYARILTFDTKAHADAYTDTGSNTGLIDAGGIALSTASTITITSKVQEQIVFCVFTNGATSCSGESGTTVTLGDTHGILSTQDPFVDKNTQFYISTNASNGVTIRIKGNTLTSGSFTIPAINAGSSTAATVSAGTAAFGLCASGSGLTISTTYNGGGGTNCSGLSQTAGTASPGSTGSTTFGFYNSGGNGLASTYGDNLASTAGPLSSAIGTVAFMGSISTSQQPGIYTTTITFIATGQY